MRYQVLRRRVDDDAVSTRQSKGHIIKAFEEAQRFVMEGAPWPPEVFVEDVLR